MNEPVLVGSVLPQIEASLERQTATCVCGATFEQTRNTRSKGQFLRWMPDVCEKCAREQRDAQHAVTAQREREMRLQALGIPLRYQGATFDSFAPHGEPENRKRLERILIAARRFLAEWPTPSPDLLVFRGGPGTGKGHLAWAIARWVAGQNGATVKFVKLPALIRDLRESWRGDGATEAARLNTYREPGLLIVDEVSRHAFYGEPTQHLYDVLDDRMDWCRPTILTTNETEAGLGALLGPALLDRVVGYGGLVDFGDVSYRKRQV